MILLCFPCWGLFCAHTQRKWAVVPPYEKKKKVFKASLLVAGLTEQQKRNKQQAQTTTALLVHGIIPAFCQWWSLLWSCLKENTCLEPSQLVLVHHLRAVLEYGAVQLLEMGNVGLHYVLHLGFVFSYYHSEITYAGKERVKTLEKPQKHKEGELYSPILYMLI